MRRPTAAPLTKAETLALVAACGRGWIGTRDRAMVALLARAGLRCGELCRQRADFLRWDGVHLVVRVSHPKGLERGAPQRELVLDKRASDLVAAWLEVRARPRRRVAPTLLVTSQGGPLAPAHVRRRLPQLARRAGLERRLHPHAMRATFARHLYDDGVGIREIQEALGHARLDTTAIYLRSVGATELAAAMKGRDW